MPELFAHGESVMVVQRCSGSGAWKNTVKPLRRSRFQYQRGRTTYHLQSCALELPCTAMEPQKCGNFMRSIAAVTRQNKEAEGFRIRHAYVGTRLNCTVEVWIPWARKRDRSGRNGVNIPQKNATYFHSVYRGLPRFCATLTAPV